MPAEIIPASKTDGRPAHDTPMTRAAAQSQQSFFYGDRVRICDRTNFLPVGDDDQWAGVWKVDRHNAKSVSLTQNDRRAKVSPALLARTDDPMPDAPEPQPTDLPAHVVAGTILRLSPRGVAALTKQAGYTADALLVVLADKVDKVNVTILGGDRDRYMRLPRPLLGAVVDPADILR
jgi:hypothetical protein